jgi:hypothetical protein
MTVSDHGYTFAERSRAGGFRRKTCAKHHSIRSIQWRIFETKILFITQAVGASLDDADFIVEPFNGISIPGHEANSARSFELFAQLVSVVP